MYLTILDDRTSNGRLHTKARDLRFESSSHSKKDNSRGALNVLGENKGDKKDCTFRLLHSYDACRDSYRCKIVKNNLVFIAVVFLSTVMQIAS